MKLTAEYILRQYTQSGKRHLFITGDRGKGKSTMFGKIYSLLCHNGQKLPGLTSYIVPKTAVVIKDNITGKAGMIGRYCPQKATVGKTMVPDSDGFFTIGIPVLQKAAADESKWVAIDEIGFLETAEPRFQQAVRDVLKQKQVLAVVRKQQKRQVEFLDEIIADPDAYVLDLDDFDTSEYWD